MTASAPYPIRAVHTFPRGFRWGTATAAHQVEGSPPESDWWAWQQQAGKIRDGGTAEVACDWWNGRWREDFDRAANDGQTTHRLSVDWSRIEPRPAIWDEDALEHYRQMMLGLRERGLEPMVTLHHFVNPLWLAERGGWLNPDVVSYFERFARKVVRALKDVVTLWCTLNEINIYAYQSYADAAWPPQQRDTFTCFRVMRAMLQAHAAAYRAIHELQPDAQVGIAHNVQLIDPYRPDFALDRWVAGYQHHLFNNLIPEALTSGRLAFPASARVRGEHAPELANSLDYIGINYYSRRVSAFDLTRAAAVFGRTFHTPGAEVDNVSLNELYPEGLYRVLRWAGSLNLPVYVTENGWGDNDEDRRNRALVLHLRQLWRAVNFNVPVKGYFYWTLVDNFEWERGWSQHFGLYALDLATQARSPRAAAELYSAVCRTNTLNSEMVAEHTPALLPQLFPG